VRHNNGAGPVHRGDDGKARDEDQLGEQISPQPLPLKVALDKPQASPAVQNLELLDDAHLDEQSIRLTTRQGIELVHAIKRVRPDLDRAKPIKQRVRVFWAAAKAARNLDVSHVVHDELYQLAIDTGLFVDLSQRPPYAADETLEHLIRWGLLEREPFGGR
jgi:hypothetical protein